MTTYYVAKDGDRRGFDSGTKSDPFDSIVRALQEHLGADDTVVVRDGVYRETLWIAKGGDASGYFTLRAENKGGAVIDAGWTQDKSAIQIDDDWVRVWGFEVRNAERSGISGNGVHHVNVVANEAHHNGGSGIYIGRGDDLVIRDNETHHNSSERASSGISVHRPEGDGVVVIRDNISHHNMTEPRHGKRNTDGHGIILDDGKTTKYPDQPEYGGRFIVANNLAHHNGGAGFLIFHTDRVRLEDNTAAHNNLDPTRAHVVGKGEIELRASDHVQVFGNVAVAADDFAFSIRSPSGHRSVGVEWSGNFAWNENTGRAMIFVSDAEDRPVRGHGFFSADPMLDDDFRVHGHDAEKHGAGWDGL